LETHINGTPANRNSDGATGWTTEDLQFHSWHE